MKGVFMKEANGGEAPAKAETESKLGKRARMIFGVIFGLGFLFLIFKMAMNRFG
jgi:hypothetical protein